MTHTTPTITVRPSTLAEAWIVGLESGEFRQVQGRMHGPRNGACAWGVLHIICQRAQMSDAETNAAMGEFGAISHAAAQTLGCNSLDHANDAGVPFTDIAAALRQAMGDELTTTATLCG